LSSSYRMQNHRTMSRCAKFYFLEVRELGWKARMGGGSTGQPPSALMRVRKVATSSDNASYLDNISSTSVRNP
jgi:hypothetical protein